MTDQRRSEFPHIRLLNRAGQYRAGKNVFRGIGASLKNLVGGELKSYTNLLNEAREAALDRMKQEAEALGANAILNVRFSTSTITQGAAELLAYGTAVVVEESANG